MSQLEALLTVSEAAARTGLCAATVREHFDAGLIVGERNARGWRLIDPVSLPMPEPTGLSVSEACAVLNRSGDTVRRWFDTGTLAGTRDRRGHRRIDPASVQALLKKAKP